MPLAASLSSLPLSCQPSSSRRVGPVSQSRCRRRLQRFAVVAAANLPRLLAFTPPWGQASADQVDSDPDSKMPRTQADIYQTQRLYVGIGW